MTGEEICPINISVTQLHSQETLIILYLTNVRQRINIHCKKQ